MTPVPADSFGGAISVACAAFLPGALGCVPVTAGFGLRICDKLADRWESGEFVLDR